MTTRDLVDPELLDLADTVAPMPFGTMPIAEIRALANARYAGPPLEPAPQTIRASRGNDSPEVECLLFRPDDPVPAKGAIIYLHGGGMVMGSARMFEAAAAAISSALGVPVIAPDYRLAPEHPFPAPHEDCYSALCWLHRNAEQLGYDPDRIILVGESAGGGLASALSLMARDRTGPRIAGQALIAPMLDHRTGGEDCPYRNPTTGEFIWTRSNNRFAWKALQGNYGPQDCRKGWFSAALADDLSDLPPTFLATGSLDLFFDETLAFAHRLSASGNTVELHSYAGAVHGFNMVRSAGVTKRFSRDLMQALARMLGG